MGFGSSCGIDLTGFAKLGLRCIQGGPGFVTSCLCMYNIGVLRLAQCYYELSAYLPSLSLFFSYEGDMAMSYVPGPMMYPGLKMRGTNRRDFHGPSMFPSSLLSLSPSLLPLSFQCVKLPPFIDCVLSQPFHYFLFCCSLPSPISFLTPLFLVQPFKYTPLSLSFPSLSLSPSKQPTMEASWSRGHLQCRATTPQGRATAVFRCPT